MPTATLEKTRTISKPAILNRPALAFYDNNDSFFVIMQMPAVDDKKITVQVEQGILTVEAPTDFKPPEDAQLKHNELLIGDYRVTLNIGNRIDEEKISATYKNGLLTLVMPKNRLHKPKKIAIRNA